VRRGRKKKNRLSRSTASSRRDGRARIPSVTSEKSPIRTREGGCEHARGKDERALNEVKERRGASVRKSGRFPRELEKKKEKEKKKKRARGGGGREFATDRVVHRNGGSGGVVFVNFKSCTGSTDSCLVSSEDYRCAPVKPNCAHVYIACASLCDATHYEESRSSVEAEMGHLTWAILPIRRPSDRRWLRFSVSFLVHAYLLSSATRGERERGERERGRDRETAIFSDDHSARVFLPRKSFSRFVASTAREGVLNKR